MTKGAGTPRLQCHLSKRGKSPSLTARCGGVTRRPSPSGREERSFRTPKDDETVESTPVFWNSFSFAGGRENEDLGQLDKPSTDGSQKERRSKAQRERLQIFRGSGLATRGCSAGIEEGSFRNCESPSARLCRPGSVSGFSRKRRFQWPASLAVRDSSRKGWVFDRIVSARCGWRIFQTLTRMGCSSRKRKKEGGPAREHVSEGGRG